MRKDCRAKGSQCIKKSAKTTSSGRIRILFSGRIKLEEHDRKESEDPKSLKVKHVTPVKYLFFTERSRQVHNNRKLQSPRMCQVGQISFQRPEQSFLPKFGEKPLVRSRCWGL
jgi:hypothetical protein